MKSFFCRYNEFHDQNGKISKLKSSSIVINVQWFIMFQGLIRLYNEAINDNLFLMIIILYFCNPGVYNFFIIFFVL
jgi:hypothetical protein